MTRPWGCKAWVQSQTQNKVQWLASCGLVSASSQSFRFILSLRMNSSFITSRPGNAAIAHYIPTHSTVRKKIILAVTWHQKAFKVKQPAFPSLPFAKLVRTLNTTQQNKTHIQYPYRTMGATIKNESTTTEPLSVPQSKPLLVLKWILLAKS